MGFLFKAILASVSITLAWLSQSSGTTASLRGVQAASSRVVWASGTHGIFLRTTNGGTTWHASAVPGAETLDFRAVHAVDASTAYLLSIGEGSNSRVYQTHDGGGRWHLLFTNPDPKGFFDALAFWDSRRGIVLGDPVNGEFAVLTTDDGGKTWQRRHALPALANEGAFAASDTCLIVRGTHEVWFATGGPRAARVFHSTDAGKSWTVASTPIRNDSASAGIFSLAFADGRRGVAVGGDYSKPADSQHNVAVTRDGGKTWTVPAGHPPAGFHSAVAYLPDRRIWIATGPSGSDVSYDDGGSWERFDEGAYNAVSFISSRAGWAVGPNGRVARFSFVTAR